MEAIEKKVVQHYVEEKLSEMQIVEKTGVPAKAIRKILDSNNISRRTISEAIRCLNITKFGKKEFLLKETLSIQDELLKVSGVMLYWGEGSKRGNTVAFSNSDPKMVRVFLRFLRRICGIHEQRLHVTIHYYEDHEIDTLTAFWSGVTGVPPQRFYKPFLHRRRSTGTYRNPSVHGTISVQYSDTKLLSVITGWMEDYSLSLLRA